MVDLGEKHSKSSLSLIEEDRSLRALLESKANAAILRFPHFLGAKFYKSLERFMVNAPKGFFLARVLSQIKRIALYQFLLEEKMEKILKEKSSLPKPLLVKLFRHSSLIGTLFFFHHSFGFQKEQLLKVLHSVLPGVQEVPRSSFLWHHGDFPYFFCYIEVQKLRGEELSLSKLEEVERFLREQLLFTPPLTPALFWPYNEEESYRQIQLLHKEITSPKDLPHVSIHFHEQTSSSLEFLLHIVRPTSSENLRRLLSLLPASVQCFCHFFRKRKRPLSIEWGAFSLKVPSLTFEEGHSINLLYVRRYILKYLEEVIGPFRDYNGGLFEKQQGHFENLRVYLGDKIPHFDLFAEKLFYALHPVEKRFLLSLKEAEELFSLFSEAMQAKESFSVKNNKDIVVIKGSRDSELAKFSRVDRNSSGIHSYAQLSLGGFRYLCFLGEKAIEVLQPFLKESSFVPRKRKKLRLVFQEGPPPSLNPHHSTGDMRSRLLSKLLFEGLVRLNPEGKPEFSGAVSAEFSPEKLLYTFKLRPCRWSNGETVTAIDYVTSWQRACRDCVSHPELLYGIKNGEKFRKRKCNANQLGVRARDAETLEIQLEREDSYFLYKLAQPYFFPLFGSLQEPKWFNGPYLVQEQTNERLFLERNPYFWDPKRSFFEQIDIQWISDPRTIYSLFQKGKLDWIGDPLSSLSPKVVERLEKKGRLHQQKVSRCFMLYFNTRHPLLRSPWIRRALSLAIDRSFICSSIFPYCIPIEPAIPLQEEANFFLEKGLQELGMTRKTLSFLTFTFSHQTRREKLAMCLRSNWQKILGISFRLEKIEWNLFRSRLEKGAFEITGAIQETLDDNALEFLERFEGLSSWNFSQWTSMAYREVIKAAKESKDKEKQQALLQEAERILVEEAPFTPLFVYTHLYACHPQLEKVFFDREGCADFSWASLKSHSCF